MRSRDPTNAIEVEPFGYGFDVRVIPAHFGIGRDREFRSCCDARRYAATLAKATGWPVVDHASVTDG